MLRGEVGSAIIWRLGGAIKTCDGHKPPTRYNGSLRAAVNMCFFDGFGVLFFNFKNRKLEYKLNIESCKPKPSNTSHVRGDGSSDGTFSFLLKRTVLKSLFLIVFMVFFLT